MIYTKTKTLGILNCIRILKDLTIKYRLEELEFLPYNGFNINRRIIFISYCRIKNQAIITQNKAAFKQIKLIQELYDLCEEKYGDFKTQKFLSL